MIAVSEHNEWVAEQFNMDKEFWPRGNAFDVEVHMMSIWLERRLSPAVRNWLIVYA
jgi:hypothetical protein